MLWKQSQGQVPSTHLHRASPGNAKPQLGSLKPSKRGGSKNKNADLNRGATMMEA
jgi:hypothetical protein